MSHIYLKKNWDETTGEPLTDEWGYSTYYFEVNEEYEVLRQVQVFANNKRLKYDYSYPGDTLGSLADQPLQIDEFEDCQISQDLFESVWNKKSENTYSTG
ncbi:MAG: hypothetical protein KGO82_09265 [Bacteroidota bacterium]|nr:hypothetical protein [Bacteroidota bacterium]